MILFKTDRRILLSFILLILLTLNPGSGMAQGTPTSRECKPFAIDNSTIGFPEIQGKSDTQELWALLFPIHLPFWVNDDVKIVWHMTGSGALSLMAQSPDGMTILPTWGPEDHGGSNWERPGQEWGAGFRFPKAGCWRVLVTLGNDAGEVDIQVIDRQVIVI